MVSGILVSINFFTDNFMLLIICVIHMSQVLKIVFCSYILLIHSGLWFLLITDINKLFMSMIGYYLV